MKSGTAAGERGVATAPDMARLAATPVRPARLLGVAGWLGPALVTLLVTAFQADRADLWRDELATWSAATRPLGDLLRLLGGIDAVWGPYYLFMHGWIGVFGDSTLALRAPGILAMTAATALTARLGARLFGARAGLFAGLLLAVAPVTSRYAQEARGYAFTVLLAVVATALLERALRRPSWPRWLGYGVAVLLLGLAHLLAAALVVGHAAALAYAPRDGARAVRRWLLTVGVVGAALLPLALTARRQQAEQLEWVDRADLGALANLPAGVFQSTAVGGAMVALAALGWAGRGGGAQSDDPAGPGAWTRFLALSALLPAALLFLVGLVTELFVPRYLVFIAPLACLLAGVALAAVRLPAAALVVLLVAVLGGPAQAALRRTHEWPRSAPREYASAAAIIREGQRPGDAIVYGSRTDRAFLDTAIAYHLRDGRPRDVLLARSAVQRGSFWATECAAPARCLAGTRRVWLLTVGQPADPLRGMATARAAPLRAEFTVERVWHVPGLTVTLLLRAKG